MWQDIAHDRFWLIAFVATIVFFALQLVAIIAWLAFNARRYGLGSPIVVKSGMIAGLVCLWVDLV